MVGTVTLELVFTVTTDAAKWVHSYGLSRPTDANDDSLDISLNDKSYDKLSRSQFIDELH